MMIYEAILEYLNEEIDLDAHLMPPTKSTYGCIYIGCYPHIMMVFRDEHVTVRRDGEWLGEVEYQDPEMFPKLVALGRKAKSTILNQSR